MVDFEDAIAAPSTAQSSSESTATFGRKSSGSGGNDDLNVSNLGPIDEVRGSGHRSRGGSAAPAVSSGTERGRQERKDRSERSSSSKPSSSSAKVVTKVTTKSPTNARHKSKSPRSSRRSASTSTGGRYNRDPEIALEQLLAEAGVGSIHDPIPIGNGTPQESEPIDAELSDVGMTYRGKRDSSQHRGEDHENMIDTGETEEVQDVVKRAKPGCPDCAKYNNQKIKDDSKIRELNKRLDLAGQQAKHFIDQVALLERHVDEKIVNWPSS